MIQNTKIFMYGKILIMVWKTALKICKQCIDSSNKDKYILMVRKSIPLSITILQFP